jgi:hypothetical protein
MYIFMHIYVYIYEYIYEYIYKHIYIIGDSRKEAYRTICVAKVYISNEDISPIEELV